MAADRDEGDQLEVAEDLPQAAIGNGQAAAVDGFSG